MVCNYERSNIPFFFFKWKLIQQIDVCIYPTPSLQVGCDTRSIFEFRIFFYETSCCTKATESSLSYYLP